MLLTGFGGHLAASPGLNIPNMITFPSQRSFFGVFLFLLLFELSLSDAEILLPVDLVKLLRSECLIEELAKNLHLVALLFHVHVAQRTSEVIIQILLHS